MLHKVPFLQNHGIQIFFTKVPCIPILDFVMFVNADKNSYDIMQSLTRALQVQRTPQAVGNALGPTALGRYRRPSRAR